MRFLLAIVFMFVCVNAYADTIVINVTKEEVKAVESIVLNAQEWLQKAWDGKAAKCIEKVIKAESKLNPNKLTKAEKEAEIKKINPKSRKEKDRNR